MSDKLCPQHSKQNGLCISKWGESWQTHLLSGNATSLWVIAEGSSRGTRGRQEEGQAAHRTSRDTINATIKRHGETGARRRSPSLPSQRAGSPASHGGGRRHLLVTRQRRRDPWRTGAGLLSQGGDKGCFPCPLRARWSPVQSPGAGRLLQVLTQGTQPPFHPVAGPPKDARRPASPGLAARPACSPGPPMASGFGTVPRGQAAGHGWRFSLIFTISCREFEKSVPEGGQLDMGKEPRCPWHRGRGVVSRASPPGSCLCRPVGASVPRDKSCPHPGRDFHLR